MKEVMKVMNTKFSKLEYPEDWSKEKVLELQGKVVFASAGNLFARLIDFGASAYCIYSLFATFYLVQVQAKLGGISVLAIQAIISTLMIVVMIQVFVTVKLRPFFDNYLLDMMENLAQYQIPSAPDSYRMFGQNDLVMNTHDNMLYAYDYSTSRWRYFLRNRPEDKLDEKGYTVVTTEHHAATLGEYFQVRNTTKQYMALGKDGLQYWCVVLTETLAGIEEGDSYDYGYETDHIRTTGPIFPSDPKDGAEHVLVVEGKEVLVYQYKDKSECWEIRTPPPPKKDG